MDVAAAAAAAAAALVLVLVGGEMEDLQVCYRHPWARCVGYRMAVSQMMGLTQQWAEE